MIKNLLIVLTLLAVAGCTNLVPERVRLDERPTLLHLYDSDADGVSNFWDQCPTTPAEGIVTARGCPGDTDGDGVPDYRDACRTSALGVRVKADGCTPQAERFETVLIRFEFDRGLVDSTARHQLDQLVGLVNAASWEADDVLEVIGHTDDLGTAEYNQRLSEQRAKAVAEYVITRINSGLVVESRGEGEHRPVASNNSANSRAQNRRVEVRRTPTPPFHQTGSITK